MHNLVYVRRVLVYPESSWNYNPIEPIFNDDEGFSSSLGQALAVATLVAYQVTYGYVKNGDITATLDAPALMIAVILGATLCCATAIMGAENNNMEGDDLP